MKHFIRKLIHLFQSKKARVIFIILFIIGILIGGTLNAWNSFGKKSIDSISIELLKYSILQDYGYDDETYIEVDNLLSEEDKSLLDSIYQKYVNNINYLDKFIQIIDTESSLSKLNESIDKEDLIKIKQIYKKYIPFNNINDKGDKNNE